MPKFTKIESFKEEDFHHNHEKFASIFNTHKDITAVNKELLGSEHTSATHSLMSLQKACNRL
jgi:hypothetical protein